MTIEIKNLNKEYNNILAVKNINFTNNKGSIVGLLGPNGCGKTTTIGMMLGLIKPTSGTVFINGQNIENENIYLAELLLYLVEALTSLILRFYNFARRLIAKLQKKCNFYPRFWSNNWYYGPE